MKKTFTKYPTKIMASSVGNVSWQEISDELQSVQADIDAFLQTSDSNMIWDTYAEAHNSGDVDKAELIAQATKKFHQSISQAIDVYKTQIEKIDNGAYTRLL